MMSTPDFVKGLVPDADLHINTKWAQNWMALLQLKYGEYGNPYWMKGEFCSICFRYADHVSFTWWSSGFQECGSCSTWQMPVIELDEYGKTIIAPYTNKEWEEMYSDFYDEQ